MHLTSAGPFSDDNGRPQAYSRAVSVGPVTLDLVHRDARIGDRWLRLRPREFALFWRLAESPGQRVSRDTLIADVWRLQHTPETNSLEVHVARLRAKLDPFGLRELVATDPDGGYRFIS